MKPIALFGSSTRSIAAVFSAQERVNVFYEMVADSEKGTLLQFRAMPGTVLSFSLPEQSVRGQVTVDNVTYCLAGQTLYLLRPNLSFDVLGTVGTTTSGRVSMATNGTQVLIVTGSAGYIYDIVANTIAQITAVGFPNSATSCIFSDGFFLVNEVDTPNFYKSAIFDGMSWDALDFDQMVSNPDSIAALDALRGTVIGWGSQSIEYWQDNGGSPFPYQQIPGTTQNIGLAAQYSRAFINNTICFMGTNLAGQVQVYALNGYVPMRISDSSVENLINSFAIVADAVGLAYSKDGHPFYQITFPSANRSFLYDFSTESWHTPQTGVGETSRHIAESAFVLNNKVYVTTETDANIYELSFSSLTDNGAPIKRSLTTRHIESGGDYFTIDLLWLEFGLGLAPQAPAQGSTPQILIECSKDNGQTWPVSRIVPFAKVGEYLQPRIITYRWGSGRDFVFRFTITDPIPFFLVRGAASFRKGEA